MCGNETTKTVKLMESKMTSVGIPCHFTLSDFAQVGKSFEVIAEICSQ